MLAYLPPWRPTSSACVPRSTMLPFSTTRMVLAFRIVESRWAMITLVHLRSLSVISMNRSEAVSRAAVGSSRTSIWGLRTSALARAMRCCWPPLRFLPRSPTS
mmetsp:Transcript_13799/g.39703  ORF Transcript_13799/g.39703 Transcript_13799/m.39703 type:complete len:103 (-) Transcript_13799:1691-1999(-)